MSVVAELLNCAPTTHAQVEGPALTHATNTTQDAFFFDGGRDFFYSIDALAFTRDIIVAVSLFLRRVQRRFS